MQSGFFVTILVTASVVAVSCINQNDFCRPQCEDGRVFDLNQLGSQKFKAAVNDSSVTYSPCDVLTDDGCNGTVLCQTNSTSSRALGTPDNFVVSCAHGNLSITFTDGDRSSVINFECSEDSNDFELQNESTNTYNFLLKNSYVCSVFATTTVETTGNESSTTTGNESSTTTGNESSTTTGNESSTTTGNESSTTTIKGSTTTTIKGSSTTTQTKKSTLSTETTHFHTTVSENTTRIPHNTTHDSADRFKICSALIFGAVVVIQLF